MSRWLNNIKVFNSNLHKTKPCLTLGWCPYGELVEEFPLDELKIGKTKINCGVFGHHCPMFYHGEDVREDEKEKILEKIMTTGSIE